MAFSWNNLFQAIALYFSYKREKGKDNPDDIVIPIPVEPKPKPDPKPKPEPKPIEDTVWSMHYSHYNPQSWDGQGVSIIFCVDSPKWAHVTLNGTKLRYHGLDHGREIWTNHWFKGKSPTAVSGTIVATDRSGKSISIKVTGSGTYLNHKGDCFGIKG